MCYVQIQYQERDKDALQTQYTTRNNNANTLRSDGT